MTGRRGPVSQPGLQRRKYRREALEAETTTVETTGGSTAPWAADENWHPQARAFYESLEDSDQSELYQESDWAKAYILAELISRELKPQFIAMGTAVEVVEDGDGKKRGHIVSKPVAGTVPMKGASLSALLAGMTSLGVSIGDRHRMGLELKRVQAGPAEKSAGEKAVEAMRDDLAKRREQRATS